MPPVLGDGTAAVYQLYMASDAPAQLLATLTRALASQSTADSPVVDDAEFTVATTVGAPDDPGTVGIELQILTLPDPKDEGIYCVEAHRLEGNHWDFQGLWSKVCAALRETAPSGDQGKDDGSTVHPALEEQIETDPQKIIF